MDTTIEIAVKDSPYFREAVNSFEVELEEFVKWLETLIKALKSYADDLSRANEVSTNVVNKLNAQPFTKSFLSDSGIVRTLADALQTVYSLKAKMVDDIAESLIIPLQQFLKEDVQDIRNTRRNFDKQLEKYDCALIKFSGLSRIKEASALTEDAFQLYEVRKAYFKISLEYSYTIQIFKQKLELFIGEQMTNALFAHSEFYETSQEVFKGLRPSMDQARLSMELSRVKLEDISTTEQQKKKSIEEEIILKSKPIPVDPTTPLIPQQQIAPPNVVSRPSSLARSRSPSTHIMTSTLSHSALKQHATEKEGYLFKRLQPKGLMPSWSRKYFYIRDNGFSWCVVEKNGKVDVPAAAVSVLLCNARVWPKEDRRFAFEIFTSTKSFVLQAETEEEMNVWMLTLQASKYKASSQQSRLSNSTTMSSAKDDSSESLVSDVDGEEIKGKKKDDEDDGSDEDSIAPIEMPPVHCEELKYQDTTMERRNSELHVYLKSVPESDHVFHVFSCALQKDIAVQGRIYLTQNKICFYSSILSFVTVLIINLKDVTLITRKNTAFYNSIVVITAEANHIFKNFLRDDVKSFETLKTLWVNATSDQPLPVQELYATINKPDDTHPIQKLSSKKLDDAHTTDDLQYGQAPSRASNLLLKSVATPTEKQAADVLSETESLGVPHTQPVGLREPTFVTPVAEVVCNCEDHLEKKEVDVVFQISAFKLWFFFTFYISEPHYREFMFVGNDIPVCYERYNKKRGNTNVVMGVWSVTEVPFRENKFTIPVNNPMVKVKETECVENQQILKKTDNILYIVSAQSQTPNIIYGDAFAIQTKYCISWVTKDSCRLIVSIGVKFFKNPMIKSMIKSAGMKGAQESVSDLVSIIKNEVEPAPKKILISDPGVLIKIGNGNGKSKKSEKKTKQKNLRVSNEDLSNSTTSKRILSPVDLAKLLWQKVNINTFAIMFVVFLLLVIMYRGFGVVEPYKPPSKLHLDVFDQKYQAYDQSNCQKQTKIGITNWTKEFSQFEGPAFKIAIKSFLERHFSIPLEDLNFLLLSNDHQTPTNTTSNLDLSVQKATPKLAQNSYNDPGHLSIYARLMNAHRAIQDSRVKLIKAAMLVDEVEKKIVKTEFVNWIADGVRHCQDSEEELDESCDMIIHLFRVMTRIFFYK